MPAKTPRAIVDYLHAETQKALAVPAPQERLGTCDSPAQFGGFPDFASLNPGYSLHGL